jgi:hypothetical protein
VERLTVSRPELQQLLEDRGGETLVAEVAPLIADYMGSTKKFVDFILEHLPEPPSHRPPEAFQHPWNPSSIRKSLKIIYDWRSRALHGGTPFPLPMCEPPYLPNNTLLERPTTKAVQGFGATWIAEDTPMYLHLFEYITRQTLLNWWLSMAAAAKQNSHAVDS